MSKIIIGIHGLGNKPPPKTLAAWWRAAIQEGLERAGKPKRQFNFELFYWAHYLYPRPLKPRIKDTDDPLYVDDPYLRAKENIVPEQPSMLRRKIVDYVVEQMEAIFLNEDLTINYSSITDFIIHHFFSDLETYYQGNCVRRNQKDCRAKEAICLHLASVLKKHRGRKILLIGHSMGSIIAYDLFTQYAAEVPIDTFVTIGSPLGIPVIKSMIAKYQPECQQNTSYAGGLSGGLKTPDSIKSKWYNLSDLRDKIAIDYKLADDFTENDGHVLPIDHVVFNDYEADNEKNPHKSYGYLRTAEMAEIIDGFLN